MVFKLSDDEVREMARIEQESGCDIQAGFDWGPSAGAYLTYKKGTINRDKLMILLQEELSALLEAEDIDAIATELQNHTRELVAEKLQAAQSS